MKKILRFFGRIFEGIYKIFDKILITPISRLIYLIHKKANFKSNTIEKILNRKQSLIVFSLLVAIVIFLFVNGKAESLVEKESEILANQPVSVVYNKEKYVVEGVPNTVDVILIGRKSDLYLAKQLDDHEIVLDLSDYKTGEYNVKLKLNIEDYPLVVVEKIAKNYQLSNMGRLNFWCDEPDKCFEFYY